MSDTPEDRRNTARRQAEKAFEAEVSKIRECYFEELLEARSCYEHATLQAEARCHAALNFGLDVATTLAQHRRTQDTADAGRAYITRVWDTHYEVQSQTARKAYRETMIKIETDYLKEVTPPQSEV